jgi:hypothetical protein
MTDETDAVPPPVGRDIYRATPGLRFIERDGKRILQQLWRGQLDDRNKVWQDVPLITEIK